MTPTLAITESLVRAIPAAVQRAAANLVARQDARGYWCGELTADTTLESDYILLQLWMHPPVDGVWNPPTMPLVQKAAQSILSRQLADGGFNIYQQGPTEISATVKAYFALKPQNASDGLVDSFHGDSPFLHILEERFHVSRLVGDVKVDARFQ